MREHALSLPPQPSSLFSEFPFVKWDSWTQYFLKFQIYNTITIWCHESPSSFQYSTLCKWHFFALEISTLRNQHCACPILSPEETLQIHGEMSSSNHFLTSSEKGSIVVPKWAVPLETWSILQVGVFFYLLNDLFILFLFLKLSCLEEILRGGWRERERERDVPVIHKMSLMVSFVM